VLKGGLSSAIYTEVLQFFLIVLGFAPLFVRAVSLPTRTSSLRHSASLKGSAPLRLGRAITGPSARLTLLLSSLFCCNGMTLPYLGRWLEETHGLTGLEIAAIVASAQLTRVFAGPVIAAWADGYDAACDPLAYEDVSGKRFDFLAFAAEGLAIARAVKRALPGWTVTYFDESLDWFYARDPRHHNRAKAEYEITLRDATAGAAGPADGRPAR